MLGLFNKTKSAEERKASEEENSLGSNLDGERQWRAAYRVMPDFQNWIQYFADEIVFEQEVAVPV